MARRWKKQPIVPKKAGNSNVINRADIRGYRPGIVLVDAGYGNNASFLESLEKLNLKYLGGIAKNRKVSLIASETPKPPERVDELAKSLPVEAFRRVQLESDKPKTLWVAVMEVKIARLEGSRNLAIVMNQPNFEAATDVDYFFTNVSAEKVTPEWVVLTYAQRNWVEVFYREAKGWLGLKEYQVRHQRSLRRHLILVMCAYTFIIWHQKTGGLRRRWGNQPLKTFTEALEAFRNAMSYRFVQWLDHSRDVFAAYKASLGYIWA